MRELDHGRREGYLAAYKQIAVNAAKEKIEEKKRLVRAEKTEHRLFALFLTASKLWR